MQTYHSGTIKGLGIATIVLSALTLALCLLGAIVLGATGAFFEDPAFLQSLSSDFPGPFGQHGYPGYHDLGSDAALVVGILELVLTIIAAIVGWEALTCVVTLIAGINAMRWARNDEKLGSTFAWSLAGAGAALLGCRLITMCVLIATAIYANKDRNSMQNAHWRAQNPTYAPVSDMHAAGTPSSDMPASDMPASEQPQAQPSAQHAPWQQDIPQPTSAYHQTYGEPVWQSTQPVATPPAAQPPAVEQPATTPSAAQPAAVEQPAEQPAAVPSAAQPAAVEQPAEQPAAMPSAGQSQAASFVAQPQQTSGQQPVEQPQQPAVQEEPSPEEPSAPSNAETAPAAAPEDVPENAAKVAAEGDPEDERSS